MFLSRCTALSSCSSSASLSLIGMGIVRRHSRGSDPSLLSGATSCCSTSTPKRPSALHSSSMLYTASHFSTQRRFASSSEGNQAFGGTFNPYKILGVDPKTPPKDVKRAYQRLALKYHPDNGETGSSEKFQAVHDAYNEIKDGKVWHGGFGGGGEGGSASGNPGQRAGGAQGRGGFYTYEEPGSTTENYFADNRRLFTFGLLMMGWCFGFLLLRIIFFIIFPLKGQAPKPPIQDVDENGVPIPPTMNYSNATPTGGPPQTPNPSSSATSSYRSPATAAASSPDTGVNSSTPFSSPPLATNFTEQERKEALERQQSGLKHVTGDMRSGGQSHSNKNSISSSNANNSDDFLSSDGEAKVYSIDFASDEVKPEPKKKGWWGV